MADENVPEDETVNKVAMMDKASDCTDETDDEDYPDFPADPDDANEAQIERIGVLRRLWPQVVKSLTAENRQRFVEYAVERTGWTDSTKRPSSNWLGKKVRDDGDWVAWLFVRALWTKNDLNDTTIHRRIQSFWTPFECLWTDVVPMFYPQTRQALHEDATTLVGKIKHAIDQPSSREPLQKFLGVILADLDKQRDTKPGSNRGCATRDMITSHGVLDWTDASSWAPNGPAYEWMESLEAMFPEVPLASLAKRGRIDDDGPAGEERLKKKNKTKPTNAAPPTIRSLLGRRAEMIDDPAKGARDAGTQSVVQIEQPAVQTEHNPQPAVQTGGSRVDFGEIEALCSRISDRQTGQPMPSAINIDEIEALCKAITNEQARPPTNGSHTERVIKRVTDGLVEKLMDHTERRMDELAKKLEHRMDELAKKLTDHTEQLLEAMKEHTAYILTQCRR